MQVLAEGAEPGRQRPGPRPRRDGGGRRPGRWLRPWPLSAALLGYLLGRAALLGHAGIFGLAWAAALRGAGSPLAPAAMVGVLAGMAGRAAPAGPGAVAAAVAQGAVGLGLIHVLNRPYAGARRAGAAAAALGGAVATAAVGALAVGLLSGGPRGAGWVDWLAPAVLAATTGVLAVILFRGVRQLQDGRTAGLFAGHIALAALVLAVGALAGLAEVRLGPVAPMAVAAGVAGMAAGWAGGPLAGAAAGLLSGLAGLLAGGPGSGAGLGTSVIAGAPGNINAMPASFDLHAANALVLGLSGLLGGAFRDLGRGGVVLAFTLSHLLLRSLSAGSADGLLETVWDAGAAATLLAALPRRWVEQSGRWLVAGMPVTLPGGDDPVRDAGSGGAARQLATLARIMRDVQQWAFQERPAPVAPTVPDALAPIVGEVVDRVCRGCSLYRHCWQQEFYRTYQIFSDVWGTIEETGTLPAPLVPDALERHCSYPREVMSAFNALHDLHEVQNRCDRRLAEGRAAMMDQVAAIARLLDGAAQELSAAGAAPAVSGAPRYRLRVGVARMPKKGSLVSGDTYLAQPINGNRYLVAISDGMGGGKEAARESQQAARLLHDLLDAGYGLDAAVQTVNAALVLRDSGDLFATVDAAVVDLASGRAEFLKVGAPPAALKRGRHVQLVKGESPPAGIVHPLPTESESRLLQAGDWLLFGSDGLWDRGRSGGRDGGQWLVEYLAGADPDLPEHLAEAVLARALETGEDEPGDDMTVVAACVEAIEANPPGAVVVRGSGEPRAVGPVPARRAPAAVRRSGRGEGRT